MRSAFDVKCGVPMPLVGIMTVALPPAAGSQTNPEAAGPKNAAPASCSSRAAPRTATTLSPPGDQARSVNRPVEEIALLLHPFLASRVARITSPPAASVHVTYASAFPSGDRA